MILAIDAGNSRVRAAFFDDEPVEPLAVAGCSGGAMFDYAQWLALLPALEAQVAARSKSPVSVAGLCSVVPGVNRLLVESVEERYQVQPVVAGAHTAKNILWNMSRRRASARTWPTRWRPASVPGSKT
jgi:pantothenate kinase type III